MAITQTLDQLVTNIRRTCDIEGTSAVARHSDAAVQDAANRGIAALYRLLIQLIPDQRFLSSTTFNTADGTATYALAATCMNVLSVEIVANNDRRWLDSFQRIDHASLTNPQSGDTGIPLFYRISGSNMELAPTPAAIYRVDYWFVPDASQLTSGAQTVDTIARLDDFIIWYGSREIATKDSKWELIQSLESRLARIESDIMVIARSRDMNGPPHIVDERGYDRYGRRTKYTWRLR